MDFESQQVNTLRPLRRHFFLRATMKGLPVAGIHRFDGNHATMDIRVLLLFRVQYQLGPRMDTSETVTTLNDMCFMAPGALIDERLSWQSINDTTAHVTLVNDGIRVAAILTFTSQAELINFVSADRYATRDDGSMVKAEWSTPAWPVITINSMNLAGGGDAIYQLPEGALCHGKFSLRSVRYNLETP